MLAIETRDLVRRFGRQVAVDNLNLHVPVGSVYGFLGPNGAGKTTTIKIIMGLLRKTSGSVRVVGQVPGLMANRMIGFLPDVPSFYGWMRGEEYLRFMAGLSRYEGDTGCRINELLDLVGLREADMVIRNYSRGMKQRLGLAQALLHEPQLVVLDEPTSALDPIGRRDLLKLIRILSERTTVFFSTHILSDVERVCDRVAILNRGRVVVEDGMGSLRERYGSTSYLIRVTERKFEFRDRLKQEQWVRSVQGDDELRVMVSDAGAARVRVPELVVEMGVGLVQFAVSEPTLEQLFVKVVGEE